MTGVWQRRRPWKHSKAVVGSADGVAVVLVKKPGHVQVIIENIKRLFRPVALNKVAHGSIDGLKANLCHRY